MAELGGQLGDLGSKLMQARKQAIESDAIAKGQTETLLEASELERAERSNFDPENMPQAGSMAESIREKMVKNYNKRLESMPTGDAQVAFKQRMEPMIAKTYMENLDWENQERTKAFSFNLEKRADRISQDVYNNPTLSKTIDYLGAMKADIGSKVGTVIRPGEEGKVYQAAGRKIITSYMNGLASTLSPEDVKRGRMLLENPPPALAEVLDAEDIRLYERRFDEAERDIKQADQIAEAQRKKALEVQRDKAQNDILADIYEGRATVKDILHGKGAVLDPDKKRTMLEVLKARDKEPKTPNEIALKRVVDRIYLPDGNPRKLTSEDQIVKEYTKGSLTWEQKERALKEFKRSNSVDGKVEAEQKKVLFNQAKATLTKSNGYGLPSANGEEQYAKFTSYALSEIEKYEKAGKDPSELLDANSPKYLGNKIASFKKTNAQAMREAAEMVKAKSAPPAPVSPPPAGKVRVMLPNGQTGMIPQDKVQEFQRRGAKVLQSGRGPSSVASQGDINLKNIVESENPYAGFLGALGEFSKLEDTEYRSTAMVDLLDAAEESHMNKDLTDFEYNYLIDKADKFIFKTADEQAIDRKNADYFETLRRGARMPQPDDAGPAGKSKGKLPELKTRKATKQDLERLKKLERDGASFK